LTAKGIGGTSLVEFATAAVVVDWRQCANNDGPDYSLGQCHWIGSIVQSSNSRYVEGMFNPQRFLISALPDAGTPALHSFFFKHQFSKGGIHAYDFLGGYADAVSTGAVNSNADLNPCGEELYVDAPGAATT
jgi:hypothetical protein